MQVVIIEDEVAAMEQLQMLLTQQEEFPIEIVERLDSVEDSIAFFSSPRSEEIDLVFLDIHLSDGSAFTIFKYVEVSVPIIFTTAYDEYALKSFEVNCLDYILKPLAQSDIERIFAKLKLIAQYSQRGTTDRYPETLLALDGWRTVPLKVAEVACFYTCDSKVYAFHMEGKRFLLNSTLERLEEQLNAHLFIRANRQFILARTAVKALESCQGSRVEVYLHNPTPEPIVISRTKVGAFKQWLFACSAHGEI